MALHLLTKFSNFQDTPNSSNMQLVCCICANSLAQIMGRSPKPHPHNPKQFLKDLHLFLSTRFQNTVPCQIIHSEEISNEFNILQVVGPTR